MQLKEQIKNKICLLNMTPNFPLGDFVKWVEESHIDIPLLSFLLDSIQEELDAEAKAFPTRCISDDIQSQVMKGYWCLYCSQVRAYYQAIVRDPDRKNQLSFLLK